MAEQAGQRSVNGRAGVRIRFPGPSVREKPCGAPADPPACRWNFPPPPEGGLGSQEEMSALQVEFSAATCEDIFSDGRRLRFQVAC